MQKLRQTYQYFIQNSTDIQRPQNVIDNNNMKQAMFPKQKIFLNRQRITQGFHLKAQNRPSRLKIHASDGANRAWGSKLKNQRPSSIEKKEEYIGVDHQSGYKGSIVRCKSIFNIKRTQQYQVKSKLALSNDENESSRSMISCQKSDILLKLDAQQTSKLRFEAIKEKKQNAIPFSKNYIDYEATGNIRILINGQSTLKIDTDNNGKEKSKDYLRQKDTLLCSKRSKLKITRPQTISIYPFTTYLQIVQKTVNFIVNHPEKENNFVSGEKCRESFQQYDLVKTKLYCPEVKLEEVEKHVNLLTKRQEDLMKSIHTNQTILKDLMKQIETNTIFLEKIKRESEQFKDILLGQPNRILQNEVQGHKLKLQELFQMASLLEQTDISSRVLQNIVIPQQSFLLTVNSLLEESDRGQDIIKFEYNTLKEIKRSLIANHEHIIKIFQNKLDSKSKKIKEFTEAMRKLENYTMCKREYLDQINRRMVVTSALVCQNIEKLRQIRKKWQRNIIECSLEKENEADEGSLDKIDELCAQMRKIYNEAHVFY